MPRLPAPTIALKARDGKLLEPKPTSRYLQGIRPVLYTPVTPRARRPADAPGTGTSVPTGYVDAADIAAHLGLPEALVVYRAIRNTGDLPPYVLVNGRPYFDPTTNLPGVPE